MMAQFSHAMAGSERKPGPWLEALPGFVTVTFVFDMFDLGQPNLVLLALMLYGFWLLRDLHERRSQTDRLLDGLGAERPAGDDAG